MLATTACSTLGLGRPVFDVAAANASSNKLEEFIIKFDGYYAAWGFFNPGIDKTESDVKAPWPKVATVKWRIAGEPVGAPLHEVTVQVPQTFPEKSPGDEFRLRFELDGEHVTAHIELVLAPPKY